MRLRSRATTASLLASFDLLDAACPCWTMTSLAVGAVAGALASSAARRFSGSHHGSSSDSRSIASEEKNVGILAIEVYTPNTYVKQSALEEHLGVPAGKYTIGLGQDGLAVTGDAEDINSLCLTVVHSLLEK